MGAPVTAGTLAGSTSGSWASKHKKPPAATSRASVDTPGSYDSHTSADRRGVRRSSSGTISATARSSSSRSASPAVRDSSVGEARRREPAVVCQQPPVVGSTQFGGRRRSRPRSRRDYRNRGKGIASPDQPRVPKQSCRAQPAHAWMRAIATARQVCWAADSEQAQSRVAWARAVPRDRCDLDHTVVAPPGVAVISSLPANALLPIVRSGSQDWLEVASQECCK